MYSLPIDAVDVSLAVPYVDGNFVFTVDELEDVAGNFVFTVDEFVDVVVHVENTSGVVEGKPEVSNIKEKAILKDESRSSTKISLILVCFLYQEFCK